MGLDVFTNNSLLVSKATFFLARIVPCSNLFILFFFFFYMCSLVYHMMETGWVKVSSTDVGELHYKYQDEKATTKLIPSS